MTPCSYKKIVRSDNFLHLSIIKKKAKKLEVRTTYLTDSSENTNNEYA